KNLPSARREALRNCPRDEQTEESAEHHQRIEPRQNAFEPTRGNPVADVNCEKHAGKQPCINVKLQPRFGGEQRNKRELLPGVVKRESQNQSEQNPACQIAETRHHSEKPNVETNRQRCGEEEPAQTDP